MRLLDDFPSFASDEIYLDSATQGASPKIAIDAVLETARSLPGNVRRGLHKGGTISTLIQNNFRKITSKMFDCKQEQVAIQSSADSAITNILEAINWQKGDEIITSEVEHHSMLGPILTINRRWGVEIKYSKLAEETELEPSIIQKITNKTKAICLSIMPSTLGNKRKLEGILEKAEEEQIKLIVDWTSLAGYQKLSFDRLPNLSAVVMDGARGLLGPPGTATILMKKDLSNTLVPITTGAGSVADVELDEVKPSPFPEGFEPGLLNSWGVAGLSASLEFLSDFGLNKIEKHVQSLTSQLLDELTTNPYIEIIKPYNDYSSFFNRISFKMKKINPHDVSMLLEEVKKISLRSGLMCAHPFTSKIAPDGLIQASVHLYNTKEDIDALGSTLEMIGQSFSN
ncbi:MAG: aminotransferase class V-fold PLP-dependent enzyme [Candidatus Heimdallarchaeota archaeon]|nr:aminotransferase class V-fold PLP-dependent enzyme [Candidatus Heimdallarchaeota archaeon]MCK5049101.1 aminotransferase class V-fold PLP-dependent enzyme [Candidatus Heimdallarchaeota archaeon]